MIIAYPVFKFAKRQKEEILIMELKNKRILKSRENSYLNYDLVECKDYIEAIQKRIKEGSPKTVRKNSIFCIEVVFSFSSKEYIDFLSPEKEKLFFQKSLEFLKNKVGEENIIFATVLKDIKIPSIHIGFVPLKDNCLKAHNFVSDGYDILKLRDEYYLYIRKEFKGLYPCFTYKSSLRKNEDFIEE